MCIIATLIQFNFSFLIFFMVVIALVAINSIRPLVLFRGLTSSHLSNRAALLEYFYLIIFIVVFIIASISAYTNQRYVRFNLLRAINILTMSVITLILSSNRILEFYFLFEILAIPMYFIIIGWGYQPEKIKSAYAIFFYTLVSSSSLLIIIMYLAKTGLYRFSQVFIPVNNGQNTVLTSISIFLTLTFLTKIPVFLFHAWLPQAHVEAPVYGSIILAGIILKVGTFGIYRFVYFLDSSLFVEILATVRIIAGVVVGISAFYSTDLKKNIAFTSVVHIALVVVLLILKNKLSIVTRIIIIVNHAFRSRALFFTITCLYGIRHSRNILFIKGLLNSFPKFSLIWFLAIIARLGIPPIVNFFGEFLGLVIIYSFFHSMAPIIIVSWIIIGAYHVLIFFSVSHGKPLTKFSDQIFYLSPMDYLIRILLITFSLINTVVIFIFRQ